MNRFRKTLMTLTLAAPLLMAGAAFAHGPGMAGGPGMDGPRVEQRLANLKAKLNITGGQESQWQAFEGKVRAQIDAARALRQSAPAATVPAPDLLARRVENMKQHIAGLEGVSAALRDLYAVLTPDQRVIVDQHYARVGRRGHRGPGPVQQG